MFRLKNRIPGPAILVLILVAAATLLAAEIKVFSHKKHAEEGADCTDCHKKDDEAGLPVLSREACAECHEEEIPDGRLPAAARRLRISFDHKKHTESGECQDCHKPTASESQTAGRPLLDQDACTACHEENGVEVSGQACVACHGKNPRETAPADHRESWLLRHGQESRWRVFGEHGQDCSECHRRDSCTACHRESRPRSHTALWRTRTHGISAAWDRESCKTCHNSGTCVRCHMSTRPLNHKGAWGSTHGLAAQIESNQHCAVCHSPAWCSACHAGAGQ